MHRAVASIGAKLAVLGTVLLAADAGTHAQDPAQPQGPITFTEDIRPIMERSCWNCHGEAGQLSDLDLRTRETAIEGGSQGPAIVPGRAEESRLYRLVAGLEEPSMPMEGDRLTDAEVAAVRAWIDEGAHWDTGATTTITDALSALEDAELPPDARDYWAFTLPVQAPVPMAAHLEHPVDTVSRAHASGQGPHGRTACRSGHAVATRPPGSDRAAAHPRGDRRVSRRHRARRLGASD